MTALFHTSHCFVLFFLLLEWFADYILFILWFKGRGSKYFTHSFLNQGT